MSPTNLNTLQILIIIALLCVGAFVISAEAKHGDKPMPLPLGGDPQAAILLFIILTVFILGMLLWVFYPHIQKDLLDREG